MKLQKLPAWLWLSLTIILGVALRFILVRRGHNFDFDSYTIVTDITKHGGNVYADTTRYNYGPIWFNLLHLFGLIADHFHNALLVLRLEIVGVLTAADLGIAFLLRKYFGNKAFVLFFLNPVSIIITGFHNQFDNVAILLGLLSVHYFLRFEKSTQPNQRRKNIIISVLLLGISLATKHIFFLFPLWLALRAKTRNTKLLTGITPYVIFAVSFLPYLTSHGAVSGVVHNVFLYRSFANAPFYNFVLPGFVQYILSPMVIFLAVLIFMGFWVRTRVGVIESGLAYLLCMVIFSPAIANQYLAIAMPAIVAFASWWFVPYVLLATILLAFTNIAGLHIQHIANVLPGFVVDLVSNTNNQPTEYYWVIGVLAFGWFAQLLYRNNIHKQKVHHGVALLLAGINKELKWQRDHLR